MIKVLWYITIFFISSTYAEEITQPQNNSNNNSQTVYCNAPEVKQPSITQTAYKVDTKIQASGQYKKSSNTTGINISNNQNVNFYNCKSDNKEISNTNINNTLGIKNDTNNTINTGHIADVINNIANTNNTNSHIIKKIIDNTDILANTSLYDGLYINLSSIQKKIEKAGTKYGLIGLWEFYDEKHDFIIAILSFLAVLTWQIQDKAQNIRSLHKKRSIDEYINLIKQKFYINEYRQVESRYDDSNNTIPHIALFKTSKNTLIVFLFWLFCIIFEPCFETPHYLFSIHILILSSILLIIMFNSTLLALHYLAMSNVCDNPEKEKQYIANYSFLCFRRYNVWQCKFLIWIYVWNPITFLLLLIRSMYVIILKILSSFIVLLAQLSGSQEKAILWRHYQRQKYKLWSWTLYIILTRAIKEIEK